jgi:hypothetical protein
MATFLCAFRRAVELPVVGQDPWVETMLMHMRGDVTVPDVQKSVDDPGRKRPDDLELVHFNWMQEGPLGSFTFLLKPRPPGR